jgi:hypothetical protein
MPYTYYLTPKRNVLVDVEDTRVNKANIDQGEAGAVQWRTGVIRYY